MRPSTHLFIKALHHTGTFSETFLNSRQVASPSRKPQLRTRSCLNVKLKKKEKRKKVT